jgi:hypothetical protein
MYIYIYIYINKLYKYKKNFKYILCIIYKYLSRILYITFMTGPLFF